MQLALDDAGRARARSTARTCCVAVGRVPNSDALNLAAAGLATDKGGFIPVNNRLETSVPASTRSAT